MCRLFLDTLVVSGYLMCYTTQSLEYLPECFNSFLTNGFVHHLLDKSTVIFRGIRIDFESLLHFLMKFLKANRTQRGVPSNNNNNNNNRLYFQRVTHLATKYKLIFHEALHYLHYIQKVEKSNSQNTHTHTHTHTHTPK